MFFCPLFSSSSGNVAYVAAQKAALLLDAGASARAIEQALAQIHAHAGKLNGILITHEHSDHIKGVGTLSRKYDIPVYANEKTLCALEKKCGPFSLKNLRLFDTGCDFFIEDIGIHPYAIPHDAVDPVGYCLYAAGKKVSVMTDAGYVNKAMLDAVERSDVLLIEANHDIGMLKTGPYPAVLKQRIMGRRGHLSNDACAKALISLYQSGLGQVILGHLSDKNNDPRLALKTVEDTLKKSGLDSDDFHIRVTGKQPGLHVTVNG
ncbi:MAG: MBL fold metallo-hydrolase [Christensenellales bacterium]|jgi:phosphoribosyl 1,2-cyclic phosphodiesterase